MRSLTALALVSALGCSPSPASDPPASATSDVAVAKPSAEPTASAKAEAAPAGPKPCGALGCTQYPNAKAALAAVLESEPVIVAVGEAHAQKGTEGVPTATRRFTEQLLPMFEQDKSDLVLELMVPDPKCKKPTEKVEKNVEKPVTKTQRASNKGEFQKLAQAAKEMGIRPHVLRPTCEHLKEVAAAGDAGVLKMLSLIAHLSDDITRRILERNARESVDKGVLLYGGAMHNNLSPREGREKYSFGPALSKHVSGKYVELDLIVPEYIKDNDSWRALPWYAHYDAAELGDQVTLFETGPASYTLIFASQH